MSGIKMKGEEFNLDAGAHDAPAFLAVYLVGSRLGNII